MGGATPLRVSLATDPPLSYRLRRGSSSIGRAVVSKATGSGFESLLPCVPARGKVGSLGDARSIAIEAHLKLIMLSEFTAGAIGPRSYIADEFFVPEEPQWLRQGIISRLEETLQLARA
jgi:hypothetical protein